MVKIICIFVGLTANAQLLFADESDQYLAWDRELADSAPAINAFVNEKIRAGVAAENVRAGSPCDCKTLTLQILPEIYLDRFRAHLISFVETSPDVDAYPPTSVSNDDLNSLSIYRRAPLQFTIRVTRTIRMGDVYMGIDKLNHLVGIGRRYYILYLLDRYRGLSEEAAMQEVMRWGIFTENTFLGKDINGIFSCADLEANYQGLLFARNFCEGDAPYLRFDGKQWLIAREVDLRDFITPGFDESYYPSLFEGDVRSAVFSVLAEYHASRAKSQAVIDRFEHYRRVTPSPAMEFLEQYLTKHRIAPQMDQILSALRLQPNDRSVPLNPLDLADNREHSVIVAGSK